MPHQCTSCDRTFADGSKEMLSGCPECGGTKFQFRPDGFDGASDPGRPDTSDSGASDPTPESPPERTDRPGDSVSRTVGNAAATVRDLVGGSASSDATQARPPSESGGATAPAAGSSASSTATTEDSDPTADADDSFDDDIIVAESEPGTEDTAQADARSQLVDPDEMPDSERLDPTEPDSERFDPTEPDSERLDPTDGDTSETADPSPGDAAAERAGDETVENGPPPSAEADGAVQEASDDPTNGRTVAEEPDAERADRPDLAELREELNDQFESIRVLEPGQYELNLMELYDREEYIIALQEDGRYSIQVPETWRQADA
jgi:predicted  nucleic acid-binding Zn-ribbon protein